MELLSQGLLAASEAKPKKMDKQELYAGLRRVLSEARDFRRFIYVGTLFLVLSSLLQNALPALAGKMLDVVASQGKGGRTADEAKRQLNQVTLALVATAFAAGICSGTRAYIFNSTSERVVASVRCKLFRSLLRQELGFFDGEKSGSLLSRLTADTEQLKDACTTSVSIFLRSSANVLVGLLAMFITSWRLTLLTLSVTPVATIAVMSFGRKIRALSKATSAAAAEAASVAGDSLGAIRVVKAFGREAAEGEHFGEAVGKTLALGITYARANGAFSAGSLGVMVSVMSLVFWFGGLQVINGLMTIGNLQAFVLYTLFISGSLAMLASVGVSLLSAIGASSRVFELMDREPKLRTSGTRRPFEGVRSISAELRGVHFAFPSRPDVWVLEGVDLDIPAGQTVALVGPSGAGKSTVSALLMRFYDPSRGSVLLAGVPIQEIAEDHLRSALSIVSQEPILFARSIRSNITFGVREATDEQVHEAARQANAHSFIIEYPEGYDTYVGERGVQLSGGQKQRVAIARALLASPKLVRHMSPDPFHLRAFMYVMRRDAILRLTFNHRCIFSSQLVLDEATSALDAASEHLVVEALDRLMADRTGVVIAHRLSTVKSANVVAVLSDGVVQERGTHSELLARGGVYHTLIQRQLTSAVDGATLSAEGIVGSTSSALAGLERPAALGGGGDTVVVEMTGDLGDQQRQLGMAGSSAVVAGGTGGPHLGGGGGPPVSRSLI